MLRLNCDYFSLRTILLCSVMSLVVCQSVLAAEDAVNSTSAQATTDLAPSVVKSPLPEIEVAPAGVPVVAPAVASEPAAAVVPVVATPSVATTPAVATAAVQIDAALVAVRDRLGRPIAGLDKAQVAALTAFYGSRVDAPVWTDVSGFTARAKDAMSELNKAEDWGLSAGAFVLPTLPVDASAAQRADAEIALSVAILTYARQASGGRVDPASVSRFNDHRGTFADPAIVLSQMATSPKPAMILQSFHPQHPQFGLLRDALTKLRHSADEPVASIEKMVAPIPAGAALKPGVTHPDIAAVRTRLGIVGASGAEQTYDKALVAAVRAFQEERGLVASGTISTATRAALNGEVQAAGKPKDRAKDIERIVINMERWRWLPTDLGRFHILNNTAEFVTRVYKDGQLAHQEKIIVGKTNTPTPQFSANMQFVIFHPEWGVPDSIKLKEIWPSLRRSAPAGDDFFGLGGGGADVRVLQKHNLRVSQNGHPVDASKVDWNKVDPRSFQFIQPAGGTNVLGVVKFRFPNRHDVYMHDTPQRDLFAQSVRTFSHGCMRVNNPRRLAEVILAEDRQWAPERVGQQIASSQSLEVKLERPFPVHVTYFTARVDEDGKLKTFADIYGHDARISAALSGKPIKLEDVEPQSATLVVAQAKKAATRKGESTADNGLGGLLQGLFGN
jgi:L,D-transpeptidase YcbB